MGTKVGELFVDIGLIGNEKTTNALKEVRSNMGSVGSMALETKAAILGAAYALERFMKAGAERGTTLSNIKTLTGLDTTKQLQQFEYATVQAGGAVEDFDATFMGVFNKIGQLHMNENRPKYIGWLATSVGFDIDKAYAMGKEGVFYVIKKIQEFAQKGVPKDQLYQVLNDFLAGASPAVKAGIERNMYRPEILKRAPIISEKDISDANEVNVRLNTIKLKLNNFFTHETAMHKDFVPDMEKMVIALTGLITALDKLATKLGVFKLMHDFTSVIAKDIESVSKFISWFADRTDEKAVKKREEFYRNGGKGAYSTNPDDAIKTGDFFNFLYDFFTDFKHDKNTPESKKENKTSYLNYAPQVDVPSIIAPKILVGWQQPQSQSVQDIDVNQNLYFQHPGENHQQIADATRQSHINAFKQAWAQTRIT